MSFDIEKLSQPADRRKVLGFAAALAAFGAVPIVGRAQDDEAAEGGKRRRPGRKPGEGDGGVDAKVYQPISDVPNVDAWKHVVYIEEAGRGIIGSGTLVQSRQVLTANHVVSGIPAANIRVRAGHPDQTLAPTVMTPISKVQHPDGDDVSRLLFGSDFPSTYPRIPIPPRGSYGDHYYQDGDQLYVAGWGSTAAHPTLTIPNVAKYTDAYVETALTWGTRQFRAVPHSSYPASQPCQFDSGAGGWSYRSDGARILIGILLFGSACGQTSGVDNSFAKLNTPRTYDWLSSLGVPSSAT